MSEKVKQSKGKANPADRLPIPGPGRPKGSQNKFTSLRDSFLEAFEELGGKDGLVEWAAKNSKKAGQIQALGTILSTASSTAAMGVNYGLIRRGGGFASSTYAPARIS